MEKGITFELFTASIPRRCISSWKAPLRYLEALAYPNVYEAKKFLDHHGIRHSLGWYGDPTEDDLQFKLLLNIPDAANATVFRLCSGLLAE